ncbi:MAG: hypothetical protein WC389_19475 [Lutibacter sp.]|jgi:hypothetical protein
MNKVNNIIANSCELIYTIGANNVKYGTEKGVCRITGKESEGILFKDWLRDTFTDLASLKPGTIISNEAIFCFEEASEIIQKKTGKEKLQRFRTYSHIVCNNEWYCCTKADKKKIFELICDYAELVCLTDSGQKHVLFKHKPGMWQLDEIFIIPDIELLKFLHSQMCELMKIGFSQTEILTGNYISNRVLKAGLKIWKELDEPLKKYRGSKIMEFAGWMLFIDEESKQKIQDSYKKQDKNETIKSTTGITTQGTLF